MESNNALKDWSGFFKGLEDETPRGAVILAGAFLDAQLRNLISNFLIDKPKDVDELLGSEKANERPLSSFGARIKVAYCLGLISKNTHDDLVVIKKIRNKFAHKMHDYSFENPEVVKLCRSLILGKRLTQPNTHVPNSHGNMFLVGVISIANWLAIKVLEAKKQQRLVPNEPNIVYAQVVPKPE